MRKLSCPFFTSNRFLDTLDTERWTCPDLSISVHYSKLPFKQIDRPQVLYEETIMYLLPHRLWTLNAGLVPTCQLVFTKSGHT